MVNYAERESVTCAALGKRNAHLQKAARAKFIRKTCKQQDANSLMHTHSHTHTLSHTLIYIHFRGRHMARTTQEGAASLKNNENSAAAGRRTAGRGGPVEPRGGPVEPRGGPVEPRGGPRPTWLQRSPSAGREPP